MALPTVIDNYLEPVTISTVLNDFRGPLWIFSHRAQYFNIETIVYFVILITSGLKKYYAALVSRDKRDNSDAIYKK
ncbi:MAG: hypothetical protein PVJ68_01790 [Candidatus Thiodiazotropha sp.]|jgi:hypothetical protein